MKSPTVSYLPGFPNASLMFAVSAATVNVIKTGRVIAAEVRAVVAMPSVAAILVPEGSIITPIPINKGAIIAIIVAVIVRVGSWARYAHANADAADIHAYAYLGA